MENSITEKSNNSEDIDQSCNKETREQDVQPERIEEPQSPRSSVSNEIDGDNIEDTLSQFISRSRKDCENQRVPATDKKDESTLESIGIIRRSNRNTAKKNDLKNKEIVKTTLPTVGELPGANDDL